MEDAVNVASKLPTTPALTLKEIKQDTGCIFEASTLSAAVVSRRTQRRSSTCGRSTKEQLQRIRISTFQVSKERVPASSVASKVCEQNETIFLYLFVFCIIWGTNMQIPLLLIPIQNMMPYLSLFLFAKYV